VPRLHAAVDISAPRVYVCALLHVASDTDVVCCAIVINVCIMHMHFV